MFLSTGLLSVVLPFFSWGLFELAAKEEKWLHWTGTNDDILGKVILGAATCDLKPQGPLAIETHG